MKKYLLLVFFFILPLYAADDPSPAEHLNFGITDLAGGMVSYPSANRIPDNTANYIQNFFTDIQPLVVERNGSIREESTVLGGTTTVPGLWSFTDTSNVEWLIAFSSKTFYKKQVGGTFSSFGYQQTVTQNPIATINLGRIWFVDGTDPLWGFDGSTSTQIASAPISSLIASWRNRLCITGTGASNNHTLLYFSADGDGTNWALGGGDADPFTTPIAGANDGYDVKCVYGMYQDTLLVGRKFDLWGIYGFGQSTEQTRKLSSEVGCIQNNTMRETDGDLIWLSARGVEKMNGSGIQLISDPIRDLTDTVVKNTANQRTNIQSGVGAWNAGTLDTPLYADTVTVVGALALTFPDSFTSFRTNVWFPYCKGLTPCTTSAAISSGVLDFQTTSGVAGEDQMMRTVLPTSNYKQGTTFYFNISTITAATNTSFTIGFSSYALNSPISSVLFNDNLYFQFGSTITNKISLTKITDSIDTTLCSGNSCQSGNSVFPSTITIFLATTTYQVTIGTTIVKSGTYLYTNNPLYVYTDFFYGNTGNGLAGIDSFQLFPETVTFTSQLISIGNNISAWAPTYINDTETNGTFSYQFGSTNTASVSAIKNFTPIKTGGTPSVATNPYAAFKLSLQLNVSTATPIPYLTSFQTTWIEGASPANVAFSWDRRYWLSFTTNTASNPTLDTVLVYQRNKTWTLLKGINAASYARWRDGMYFGDSSGLTGLVYQYDVGNNDDGNAITSILRTKSYDLGVPYRAKDLRRMYIDVLDSSQFTGSFSMTYDVDRLGNSYTLGSGNLNDTTGMVAERFPFPLSTGNPTQGREVQYTLTKSGTGDRLQLYEFRTLFFLKSLPKD